MVNVKRVMLKKKYTNYVTNFKKDVSKLQGGYLVCDGRGRPVSFSIHHAPPQVDKATLYRPNTTSASPSTQSSMSANAVESNYDNNDNSSSSGSGNGCGCGVAFSAQRRDHQPRHRLQGITLLPHRTLSRIKPASLQPLAEPGAAALR